MNGHLRQCPGPRRAPRVAFVNRAPKRKGLTPERPATTP